MNIDSLLPITKKKILIRERSAKKLCKKLGIILPNINITFLYMDDQELTKFTDNIYKCIFDKANTLKLNGFVVYANYKRNNESCYPRVDIAVYNDGVCGEWIRFDYNIESNLIEQCDINIYEKAGLSHDNSKLLQLDKSSKIQAISSDELRLFALLNMAIICQ